MKITMLRLSEVIISILLLGIGFGLLVLATQPIQAQSLAQTLSGKILLQVEENGEAWYVFPDTNERYFLGRPADAFRVMRDLGLGISTDNLISIPIAADSKIPETNSNKSNGNSTEGQLGDQFEQDRAEIMADMNAERTSRNLSEYLLVQELSAAAQAQADDMTAKNYFEFTSPQGKTITDFLSEEGYVAHTVAQNLVQTNKGAGAIVGVWKSEQQVSFDNVIHNEYEEVGIGIGEFEGVPIYVVVFARSLENFFAEETQALQNLDQVRQEMLARLNQERALVGLSPLALDGLLNKAAQGHTDDMLNRSYYSHDTPEGLTSHDRIKAVGYSPSFSGENIAKGQFSVQEVMDSWMDSPAHRDNILNQNFTEVGFGLSLGPNQNGFEVIWAQNFGTPL